VPGRWSAEDERVLDELGIRPAVELTESSAKVATVTSARAALSERAASRSRRRGDVLGRAAG